MEIILPRAKVALQIPLQAILVAIPTVVATAIVAPTQTPIVTVEVALIQILHQAVVQGQPIMEIQILQINLLVEVLLILLEQIILL